MNEAKIDFYLVDLKINLIIPNLAKYNRNHPSIDFISKKGLLKLSIYIKHPIWLLILSKFLYVLRVYGFCHINIK